MGNPRTNVKGFFIGSDRYNLNESKYINSTERNLTRPRNRTIAAFSMYLITWSF